MINAIASTLFPPEGPTVNPQWLTEERYAQRHTAKREWVGLTDKEYQKLHLQMGAVYFYQDYGRAIEAKLKAKNSP